MLILMVNVSKGDWMKMENLFGLGIPAQMNLEEVSYVLREIYGSLCLNVTYNLQKK